MSLRLLLTHELERLGHEVLDDLADDGEVEIALLEPADARCVQRAQSLRRANPGVRVIILSEEGPSDETHALEPVVHLMKPYSLAAFAQAMTLAADQRP